MITIRSIHLRRDLPSILKIEEATFGEDAFPLSEFLYLYMRDKHLFLVAYDEATCVGYISAYSENQQAYIASIAIDETFRRRGIGRQLISEIIKRIKALGVIKTLSLHVRQSNLPAIKLYQTLDFSIIGTEANYYLDEDAYVMLHHI